jgi:hypothetical protein
MMKPSLTLPSNEAPIDAWLPHLREVAAQDLPMARRMALLRLVWQQAYWSRKGLVWWVEDLLGQDCFGASPRSTFYRDMAVVRQALAENGHRLLYGRRKGQRGYYVEGRPRLDEHLRRLIAGAMAEVDPRQIAISRKLTPAQRFRQGCSMVELAERVGACRLRQRQPHLSEEQARRMVREGRFSDTP